MAPKRLTRREIVQQDRIQATLSGIYEWSSENRYLLLSLLGFFVLSILGSNLWQYYQERSSHQLQTRFSETLDLYHAPVAEAEEVTSPGTTETEATSEESGSEENAEGITEEPEVQEADPTSSSEYRFQSDQERLEGALAGFTAIAQDYSKAQLGLLARYYMGLIKQELGQTEEAEQDLNFVIGNAVQTEIQNLARNLLAGIAQSKNDPQQATALLEQILLDESDSFPKSTVLLELAQTHEAAGNSEEALRFYRRLTTEYPTSQYIQEARSHIDQLETLSNQD
ncbi:tetratricopeptide repeat protein, partial [Acidobacteria bacterium AH-259-D05]|nr:tetratricopeptide repeat protein [Acidobacteria bacterium AH-259-D05]